MKTIIIGLGIALCFACQRNRGTSASLPVENSEWAALDSFRIIDPAKIPAGVKYKEDRSADPANPPVVLDFTEEWETGEWENLNFSDSVKGVMIEHPVVGGKDYFLRDCPVTVIYKQGMSSFDQRSDVWISDDYIVAGDIFMGMFAYNRAGELVDTIALCEFPFKYTSSPLSIECKGEDMYGYRGAFDLNGKRCSYIVCDTSGQYKTVWRNLELKRSIQELPWSKGKRGLQALALDDKTYFGVYSTIFSKDKVFMRIFGFRGDTLCEFQDYIRPTKEIRGNYSNPDKYFCYKLKGKQYIRQPYNDTIFQILDAHRLLPVYLLNFGNKRTDITTGLIGDKTGKLIPSKWIEIPSGILFSYTENYDCPNTRDRGIVKYFYCYYDKGQKQLYRLPAEQLYPEEFLVNLPSEKALPFTWEQMTSQNGKIVVIYTRSSLEAISKLQAFSSLPEAKQKQVKDLLSRMNDRQMYVMEIGE